ncbi:hypothetical protein [Dyadobacter sp. CY312]|uniref:hypothetical protein n=1 Tax=Dyadobacter sp. CY312 TaxID=2907303 RepID=UPI001F2F50CB|nr:hypothetical protein [Dyadobacter sp. CY312]MCE7039027.1 hypothetical protein [Dyadobacter sp. CY312]
MNHITVKTMKNPSQNTSITSLLLAVAVLSCVKPVDVLKDIEEIPKVVSGDTIGTGVTNPQFVKNPVFLKKQIDTNLITGVIVREVADSPIVNWLQKDVAPYDLGSLKISGNQSPMLVFGDGLSAGWMNGGLYRAAQQESFPNLVAHQMGIKNFKTPLFEKEHGNGTGYLVLNNKNGEPTWSEVKNNVGIVKLTNVPELVPYLGGEIHNMSEPRLAQGGIGGTLSPEKNGWTYDNDGRGWTDDMIFFWRMKPNADKYVDTYWDWVNENLNQKKPALVLSSFAFDSWVTQHLKNDINSLDWQAASSEATPLTVSVAREAQRAGSQGIAFTIPAFKHVPYFKWQTHRSYNITEEQIVRSTPDGFNERIKNDAKQSGVIVVDIASLYEKVYAGNYTTEDGYKIDGKAGGNFFSGDGIYPSAIGHAVIANEIIKVINQHFKSKIPLIKVGEFAAYYN